MMQNCNFTIAMVEYDRHKKELSGNKFCYYEQNVPPERMNIAYYYQVFCFYEEEAVIWIQDSWHVVKPPAFLFVPPLVSYAICGFGKTITTDQFFIFPSALRKIDDCIPGKLSFYDTFLSFSLKGNYIHSMTEKQAVLMRRDLQSWWEQWSENGLVRDEGYSAWAFARTLWNLTSLCNYIGKLPAVSKVPVHFQVVEWITENLNQNFTISDIAKELHLSPEHIQRKFKKETGYTLMNFVLNLKLSMAARYMTIFSPHEAAEKAGFSDFSYFCQVFKKHYGATPSQFHKYETEIRKNK